MSRRDLFDIDHGESSDFEESVDSPWRWDDFVIGAIAIGVLVAAFLGKF